MGTPTGPFGPYQTAEDIPENERKYYHLGDKFRPIETIDFVEMNFNNRWPVQIPRFLAEYHGWWDVWEKERNVSMAERLKPGMVLYDVGAFDGWLACVYAQFVGGGENIVLIEPVAEEWPNTKLTWEANKLNMPRATYMGFAADILRNGPVINQSAWPKGPDYSHIIKSIKFKLLSEQAHVDNTASIPIDVLATRIVAPDALTIDVEGAGLIVLKGAEQTLRTRRPPVWISLHPDFMRQRFSTEPEELHEFMDNCGYTGTLLASDHEDHWFYEADK